MATATLHYFHDPFCGWCYGAAPLVAAARAVLPVRTHGGGMLAGPARQRGGEQWRGHVLPHDRRIAQMTGQVFGDAYLDGLLRDPEAVFDSLPAIAAVLAADTLAGKGLDMLARLQVAHYGEGRRIAEAAVLVALAAELGLEPTAFRSALDQALAHDVAGHISETRRQMARHGLSGFPSFLLEVDGRFERVDASAFLGQPAQWSAWLAQRLQTQGAASVAEAVDGPSCGLDGCV